VHRSLHRIALDASERLGAHRRLVAILAVLSEGAFLAAVGSPLLGRAEGNLLLLTGAVAALIAWCAALAGGAGVGLVASAAAGAFYVAFVAGLNDPWQVALTVVAMAILGFAAYLTGSVADALRRRVEERERSLTGALEEAVLQKDAAEEILASAPRFYEAATVEEAAAQICAAAVHLFRCDRAVFFLLDRGVPTPIAAAPESGGRSRRASIVVGSPDAAAAGRLAWRRPVFIGPITSRRRLRPVLATLLSEDTTSALLLPVLVGSAPHALISLGWTAPLVRPGEATLLTARRFADQAALVLAQVGQRQALDRADSLHVTLETSLLPRLRVDRGDVMVVAAHRPGERALRLGGDFFDAVEGPDGRVSLIIGDVCGHGPDAAALGATLRAGWRALSLADTPPVGVMETLSTMLLDGRASDQAYATMCLAWIDPSGSRLTVLNAGHLPPLLIRGEVSELDTPPVVPIGLASGQQWITTDFDLESPWTVFLHTDGLIEGRLTPWTRERYGETRLRRRLRAWSGSRVDEFYLTELLDELQRFNGGAFRDDVAVLAASHVV
jgi:serine phosphatase RsbU (regulator of sigma subunit)